MAGVRRDEDFAAWQLADAFKKEVFRLVRQSRDASRDFKYRNQLQEAAGGITKHITEGYLRFSPLDFARFLDYALGSRLKQSQLRYAEQLRLQKHRLSAPRPQRPRQKGRNQPPPARARPDSDEPKST